MKIKLNFLLGKKTVNGRFYDPGMLKTQLEGLLKKEGRISVGPDSKCINETTGQIPDDMVVGYADSFTVLDDGTVEFDVKEMSEQTEEYLQNNPDKVKLSIYGFGSMDENKNVRTFSLTSLFMTTDG